MTRQPYGPLPFPPLTPTWGDNSQEARRRESADGIERGRLVLDAEQCENQHTHRRDEIARRGRQARRRTR